MNQCARTFMLVGMVVAILLALHFLPKISLGDTELRRVNVLSDVLPEVLPDDLDAVPALPDLPQPVLATAQPAAPATPADSSGPISSSPDAPRVAPMPMLPADSALLAASGPDSAARAAAATATVPEGVVPILDYSQGQPGGMYHFYRQLASARQLGRPVRVAYYGDSFIEGDIFTADLRCLLQDRFGGSGVGWVDCASQVSGFRQSVQHSASGITEYEVVKRPFSQANQGIAQRYFTAAEGARISLKGGKSRRHQGQWDRAIFYLRTDGGLTLRTTMNGDTTATVSVTGSPNLQALVSQTDSTAMSSVLFQLSSIGSGTLLYGVALEPRAGVVVDNFSMRGSAGFTLEQIPAATLSQFAAQRPYDLIVLHFGLNVANSKSSNYSSYTQRMGQALEHLRRAYPQASILVVSMPDRDQRTDAGLRTMRGVEALVAYQQIMAADHGVSFFNLFQAMGGRESMKDLVDRGMANKDYTHINFAGGRQLAQLLYQALMAGYGSYFAP